MDLFGWDVVSATDIALVNSALEHGADKVIPSFEVKEPGISASGKFGAWKIVPGASGTMLMLSIAIASGSVTPDGGAAVDLAGMSAVFRVTLSLLPSPSNSASTELRFDFQSVGDANAATGAVQPISIDTGGKLTEMQEAALLQGMANGLVANADKISFVFAEVNPAASLSWMKPVHLAYCYEAPTGGAEVLAILAVTTDRDVSGLDHKVDPSLLSGAGNCAVAVSPVLFMRNIMVPALAPGLHGKPNDFTVTAGGTIKNVRSISLPKEKKGLITYYPKVTQVRASISDTRVELSVSGSCDMYMGVSMTFDGSSSISAAFAGGKMSFKAQKPVFHKHVHMHWYDHLFAIITWLAEIILQIVVNAIGSALANGLSSIAEGEKIGTSAADMVRWGGASGFAPTSGGLATAFYLQGNAKS